MYYIDLTPNQPAAKKGEGSTRKIFLKASASRQETILLCDAIRHTM
jgi:hypothetical protein